MGRSADDRQSEGEDGVRGQERERRGGREKGVREREKERERARERERERKRVVVEQAAGL